MHPDQHRKYIAFSLGNLRFVESKLVKENETFPITQRTVPEENKRRLLLKKGIYPYEYMDLKV